jgi:hypothetical protein
MHFRHHNDSVLFLDFHVESCTPGTEIIGHWLWENDYGTSVIGAEYSMWDEE